VVVDYGNRVKDCGLMPSEQFFSHIMANISCISITGHVKPNNVKLVFAASPQSLHN
jgi:hypothetical protein